MERGITSETDAFEPADVSLDDPALYLSRELSELAFQRRVLHEALDDRNPLLERVRFLSIVTRNLDEFVMKRVGGLKQQIESNVTEQSPDGRLPEEQWQDVHETLRPLLNRQAACYRESIRPALAEAGIHIHEYDSLSNTEQAELREHFKQSIMPTLTPLSFDPAHPFPFISNRSLSLAVLTRRDRDEEPTFTRVKIPPNQPRLIQLGDDSRYIRIEAVIRANLDLLLPSVEIVDTAMFRLTRNAEVRQNEEVAEDLIDMVEGVLEQRRFAAVVRMELSAGADQRIRSTLKEQLDLTEREVYELDGPLDYRDFMELTELERPDLKLEEWTPQPHPRLGGQQPAFDSDDGTLKEDALFERIQQEDVLLHHPYHDFEGTVQRFLSAAAEDPDVLAVKAAIYRTASDSQVIQSLIDAADNGKQVAVMVELKARFDEQNNLEWVRTLEENGIHVAYGTVGLKTHTKTALAVREEKDGVQLYSHVGTGNYHSGTAKGYVDLGLLTADQDIGRDLVKVFNFFTGPSLYDEFQKLLIAPVTMRQEFTRLIRREAEHAQAGRRARIVVKINGLEDPAIVEELYRASMAGVEIDLIVRDICRLRPGIEGISETVSVYSLVGRFLEHSRIFYFENGGDPEYYIGSADWMTRNLDSRVEAVSPVTDPTIQRQLRFNLELVLADNRKLWEMDSEGAYHQRHPDHDEPVINAQEILMRETLRANRSDESMVGAMDKYPFESDLRITGDGAATVERESTTGRSDEQPPDGSGSSRSDTESPAPTEKTNADVTDGGESSSGS
jgi:polyphosphate kinase